MCVMRGGDVTICSHGSDKPTHHVRKQWWCHMKCEVMSDIINPSDMSYDLQSPSIFLAYVNILLFKASALAKVISQNDILLHQYRGRL